MIASKCQKQYGQRVIHQGCEGVNEHIVAKCETAIFVIR